MPFLPAAFRLFRRVISKKLNVDAGLLPAAFSLGLVGGAPPSPIHAAFARINGAA
jgi:hypothetical protein